MKKCPVCLGEFKNLGAHMRKHSVSKNVRLQVEKEQIQKANAEETDEKTEVVRPLDRFGNGRFVFGNGAGVILRR